MCLQVLNPALSENETLAVTTPPRSSVHDVEMSAKADGISKHGRTRTHNVKAIPHLLNYCHKNIF